MRIIVYGVGAVGGVIAGALTRAGHDCIGIARGARLEALRKSGLLLRAPGLSERVELNLVADPSDIDWREGDAILMVMKGQHTPAALEALRAAGVDGQPVFCAQNGVANEAAALRLFLNVHGITVMLPAEYVALDEAVAFASPNFGIFDIGRYPSGADAHDEALADALTGAGIAGFVQQDVMQSKYGKLLMNLGNIVEAALGRDNGGDDIRAALRAEGAAVLQAAGISWADVKDDPRRALMKPSTVEGAARLGSSTTQSLARGSGSVETDYLNGEIALLARLHGVPAPLNAGAARLAARLAREGTAPGHVTAGAFRAAIGMGDPPQQ